jgi:replicative DNA helicase
VESDPEAIIAEAEKALLEVRQLQQKGSRSLKSFQELGNMALDYHRRRLAEAGENPCVTTGLAEFDRITGGLLPGELIIGAGRPSHGKTAVALHFVMSTALAGKRACLFTVEMNEVDLMNRYLTGYAGVDPSRLRQTLPDEGDFLRINRYLEKHGGLPLYIDYTPGASADDIYAKVMLQKQSVGCDLVAIDYLHVMDLMEQKGENTEKAITRTVNKLKKLAGVANCPILLFSQLNRDCERRPDKAHVPILSDLRDSGSLEQVASCVFFVYRPEMYGITKDEVTGENLQDVIKLIIAKNQHGGTGVARLHFNPPFTRGEGDDPTLFD